MARGMATNPARASPFTSASAGRPVDNRFCHNVAPLPITERITDGRRGRAGELLALPFFNFLEPPASTDADVVRCRELARPVPAPHGGSVHREAPLQLSDADAAPLRRGGHRSPSACCTRSSTSLA